MKKVIITCAVTGSAPTTSLNPAVPVTPAEIASSAIDAAREGASIVHLHVRNPNTGKPSSDTALYQDVVHRIRSSGTDVIINLTTGPGARFVHSCIDPTDAAPGTTLRPAHARIAHALKLKPEICSVDVATMNRQGFTLVNQPDQIRHMLDAFETAGIKPELEIFDGGHLELAKDLLSNGGVVRPYFIQFCLGIKWGLPATEAALTYLASQIPPHTVWSAFGIGKSSLPIVEKSVALGGHVRVGFEDNLYLRKGVLAPSNAALVAQAVQIIKQQGASVANVSDTRSILDLEMANQHAD